MYTKTLTPVGAQYGVCQSHSNAAKIREILKKQAILHSKGRDILSFADVARQTNMSLQQVNYAYESGIKKGVFPAYYETHRNIGRRPIALAKPTPVIRLAKLPRVKEVDASRFGSNEYPDE